jgi:hypothetical protein
MCITIVKSPGRGIVRPTKEGTFQGSNDVYSFGWGEWGQLGTRDAPVSPSSAAAQTTVVTTSSADSSDPNINTPKLMEVNITLPSLIVVIIMIIIIQMLVVVFIG